MIVTAEELREWLASLDDQAEVRMAGVPDVGLIGWTAGRLFDGRPVALLAFEPGVREDDGSVAYIECIQAQEAAYWESRRQGMNLNDKQIGDLLRAAAPHILGE